MKKVLCAGGLIAGLAVSLSTGAHAQSISLELLGRYTTGLADIDEDVSSGETVALRGDKMYVTNADDRSLDIVDVSDPAAPELMKRVDLGAYGASVNSVDVSSRNLIAVAIAAAPKTDPGRVVFLTPGGQVIRTATVGANPDMVVFTPDGRRLLVANEGEPDCYLDDDCTDPVGSISVIDVIPMKPNLTVNTIGFGDVNIPLNEIRIYGPGATPAQDLEPEYIAVSDDGQTAWVSLQENNAIARLDLKSLAVTDLFPLGYKDHGAPGNGLDTNDDDEVIDIRTWSNVLGMYQPDAIAQFEVDGATYLVSANEGDAREYDGFEEEERAEDLAGGLNPGALKDAASDDEELGRLNATNTPPNGDLNNLYAFGARSFSIWNGTNGAQVWDSGDQLEQITADELKDYFNSSNTNNELDNRSDNKGPEPEGVAVGAVGGRRYAFVGLERIGGVMVFEVTDPGSPEFAQYFVTREFDPDPIGPDSGPEIIRFIEAKNSPTGAPLLAVAHEITGTVILVGLTPNP